MHTHPMETELFAGNDLRTVLDQAFRAVVRHIARLSPESLLSTSDQEITDGLVADASAACPQLQVVQAEALPVVERSEDVGLYGDGSVITHEVPRWRLVVPFTGDTRIFQYRPSRRALTQPVVLDVRENELELFVDGRIAADKIHRVFDASIRASSSISTGLGLIVNSTTPDYAQMCLGWFASVVNRCRSFVTPKRSYDFRSATAAILASRRFR
jgi:hypothetical protein